MAKIKKCRCGKIYYEDEFNLFPDICEECHAILIDFNSYEEDEITISNDLDNENISNCLFLSNKELGISIPILNDCIIGRGEKSVGHNQLIMSSISREHAIIKIRNKFSIDIEDISTFGTKINGKKMIKGIPQTVSIGDTVTLYECKLILERK